LDGSKIVLELTVKEATLLANLMRSVVPSSIDEMIVMMLYARIMRKIEEAQM
jgi:hypothetical protein